MSDPDVVPGADRAVVPREKLEHYLLDPTHPVGRHKARVFAAALGIRRDDWKHLRNQLAAGIRGAAITAVRETPWGDLYEAVLPVDGLNGRSCDVYTVWLVARTEPPRFETGYVVGSSGGARCGVRRRAT